MASETVKVCIHIQTYLYIYIYKGNHNNVSQKKDVYYGALVKLWYIHKME